MGACVGKYKRSDNESNRESQKHKFGFSTAHKRGQRKERILTPTRKQKNIDDPTIIGKAHLKIKY